MVAEASAEHPGDGPEEGEWLSIPAAARRLGITPRAVRGRIARRSIEWKPAGNTGRLVLIRPGDVPEPPAEGPDDDPEEEIDRLREEMAEVRIALARAEAERDAARAIATAEAAAHEKLVAELRAELTVHRLPFWRRLLGR